MQALTNPGYGTAEEEVSVIKKGPKWVPAFQYGRMLVTGKNKILLSR